MRKPLLALAAAATLGVAAVPAYAATYSITVKDNVFSPKTKTVKKGDTVKFVWRGNAPHDVVVKSGPVKFASKVQTRGTYTRKLTRTGLYRIVCTIHPGMALALRVK